MKGYKILLFQFFYLTLIISSFAQSSKELKIDQPYVKNQLIIKFKNDIDIVQKEGVKLIINDTVINNIHKNFGIVCERILFSSSKNNLNLSDEPLLYKFNNSLNIEILISKLLETNLYEYVEPNYLSKGHGTCTFIPNDFYFNLGNQWGLVNTGSFNGNAIYDADIDMEFGWGITKGNQNTIVAVLDGGTKLDHIELNGRLWTNPTEVVGNGIDDDANGYIDDINGWDFVNSDNDPTDDNGHGTNVIGIIGATGNNGIGYAGVNWNCKLMTCKVLDSLNTGPNSGVIAAIYYSVDNGADVINMSLGSGFFSAAFEAAIDYAYNNNVVTIASMGNDNNNITQYPAGYTNCIAVGATDTDNKRVNPFPWSAASGSNYGNHIDVVAPGNYIYGLSHLSSTNYNTYYSGTSQAAPLVTGLVSLIRGLDNTISPDSIRSILHNTSIDQVGDISEDVPGWDQYYGYGLINTYNALKDLAIGRDTVHICSGTNYTFPDGSIQYNITSLTIDTSYIQSASFCDSTVITTLIVDSTVFANTTDSVICFGDSVILTGSGAATSYSWDNGVVDGAPFYPTSTATYTVTGNISGSCNSDQITVVVNQLPTVSANSSSNNICIGNDLFLYGSGNSTSYTWDNGAIDSVIFSPTLTTLYTVLGTDSNNCVNSDTITIFVSSNPTPNLSITASDTTVCIGDSVTLSGNGATNYIWNNGITNGIPFILDSSQIFLLTGTDVNGCSDTLSININVDTVTTYATTTKKQVCFGDSVVLFGTGTANMFSWDNGVIDSVGFIPSTTNTYIVTGSINSKCQVNDTITIIVHPTPLNQTITTTGPTTLCENDGVTLSIPNEIGMSYCWNYPDSSLIFNYIGQPNFTPGSAGFGDIAYHPVTNQPFVIFHDGANSSKLSVMKFDGINWQYVGTPGISAGNVNYLKITFNSTTNEPYIVFYDQVNIGTVVMKFNGLSWQNVGPSSPSIPGYASRQTLKIHPVTNKPYVAFKDYTNGGKASVMKFNGSNWELVGANNFSNSINEIEFDFHPITKEPYIAYSENISSIYKNTVRRFDGNSWVAIGTPGFTFAGSHVSVRDIKFHPATFEPYLCFLETQFAHVMRFNGSSWVSVGASLPSSGTALDADIDFNPVSNKLTLLYTNNQIAAAMELDAAIWNLLGKLDFSNQTIPYYYDFLFHPVSNNITISFAGPNSGDGLNVMELSANCLGGSTTYSPTVTGDYGVIITTDEGCSISATNQIFINPIPEVIATFSLSICSGDSVKLTGNGNAVSYVWNGGAILDESVVSPSSTTNYIVAGMDSNNCYNYDTTVVTVKPTPNSPVISSSSTPLCSADSLILSTPSIVGLNYCWEDSSSMSWSNVNSLSNVAASNFIFHPVTGEAYACIGNQVVKLTCDTMIEVGSAYGTYSSNNTTLMFHPTSYEPYILYRDINTNYNAIKRFNGSNWITICDTISYQLKKIVFHPISSEIYGLFVDNSGTYDSVFVERFNGLEWISVGSSIGVQQYLDKGLDLAFNKLTNEPYVSFSDNLYNGKLSVYRYTGSSWVVVGSPGFSSDGYLLSTAKISFSPIIFDPYIFYLGNPNSSVSNTTVMKFNGTNWQILGTPGFISTWIYHLGMKFDLTTNEPYIPYIQGSQYNSTYTGNYYISRFDGTAWDNTQKAGYNNLTHPNSVIRTEYALHPKTDELYNLRVHAPSWGPGLGSYLDKYSRTCLSDSNNILITNPQKYSLMVTNSNCCSVESTNDIKIFESPKITANLPVTSAACYGDSVKLFGSGNATTYNWNNGITDNQPFIANSNNTYIVTGIDSNNCTDNDTVNLIVHPVPNQPLITVNGNTNLCNSQSIELSTTLDTNLTYCWYKDDEMAWQKLDTGIAASGSSSHSDIAVHPITGETYVAFSDGGYGNKISVKKFNGNNWEYIGSAGFSAYSVRNISIKFNPITLEPYVAFIQSNTFGYSTRRVSIMKYDGLSWSYLIDFSNGTTSANDYTNPSFEFHPQTNVMYFAYKNSSGMLSVYKKVNTSIYGTIVSATNMPTVKIYFENLAFHPKTFEPYVVFSDDDNGDKLSVIKYDGNSWNYVGLNGFSAGGSKYGNIAFNPVTFEPYVAFSDLTVGSKSSVMKFNGSSWQLIGSAGFSNGSTSYLDLAFNPTTSEPYLAYIDQSYTYSTVVKKYNGSSWLSIGADPIGFSGNLIANLTFSSLNKIPYIDFFDTSVSPWKLYAMKYTHNCLNDSNFLEVDSAGIYQLHVENSYGCSSHSNQIVVTTSDSIPPTVIGAVYPSDTVCYLDSIVLSSVGSLSYIWNNGVIDSVPFSIDSSTTYILTGTDSNNCSNYDTITVMVNNKYNISDSIITCSGQPYTLPGGNVVFTSGIYQDTLATYLGCDSVVITDLTFSTTLYADDYSSICQGEIFILPVGDTVSLPGNYIDTINSVGGCDSIITTHITMNPKFTFNQDTSICQGDSVLIFGIYQSIAGVYYDSLQTINGCDSVLSITLSVNSVYLPTTNDTICQGDSIFLYGEYRNVAGTYYDSLQTINGCDSVLSTVLIVNSSYLFTQNQSICQGDSVLIYGNYQSIAGTYYDSLQTINGCDSVLSTTLTIDSSYLFNQNQSICQGDSILIYGNYQSVVGTYYDSLQTINGCDSVLSITLSVNPVYLSNTNDTICQGDSLLIYGNYENTAGVYYDTLQTILGCDSVLATTLFLNANFNTSQNQEICQGDSALIYGTYQYTSGVYYDSLQTINGCDSILSTTLTVNFLPNVTLSNFNPDTICSNSNAVTLPNGSPSGGVYSGTGVNGGIFDPNTAGLGTHNVIYTYTDANSCINSDSTFITVEQCVGIDDLENDLGILIYPNPNTGLFTIEKSSELDKKVNISLLDASSRVVLNKIISKGQQKIEMDITSYSKGVYYLQLTVGKEVFVKQILKN